MFRWMRVDKVEDGSGLARNAGDFILDRLGGVRDAPSAGMEIALADDPKEEFLQGRRRMVDREEFAAVPGDHVLNSPEARPREVPSS